MTVSVTLPLETSLTPSDAVNTTISLPIKSMDRLDNLVHETEAASRAEVLRNALRLYEHAIMCRKEGAEVYVKDRDGKETSVFSR